MTMAYGVPTAYEKYYRNFEQPPPGPTFTPTEVEFRDPIAYIDSLRAAGERYGIIKIKPPEVGKYWRANW